jgi:hypothetical protein
VGLDESYRIFETSAEAHPGPALSNLHCNSGISHNSRNCELLLLHFGTCVVYDVLYRSRVRGCGQGRGSGAVAHRGPQARQADIQGKI